MNKNKVTDARSLPIEILEMERKRAIKMRREGEKNCVVAEKVGLSQQTISTLYTRYKKEGKGSLEIKKKGRPKGTGRKLSKDQEEKIFKSLIDNNPRELNYELSLWTRECVQQLISSKFGVDMPISTVGDYLKRWKLVSRNLKGRITKKKEDDNDIYLWFSKEYNKIVSSAKKDDYQILWADQFSISQKTLRLNMIYVETSKRKTMFSLHAGEIGEVSFINFMEKVIDSFEKKVYLVLEDLQIYKKDLVKGWLEDHEEEIKIFTLPSKYKSG